MERKRIAVALAAIAIVGLFAGGSIYAYFSDTKGVDGNTFTSGTLYLTVDSTKNKGVSIGEVYPGWGTDDYPDSVDEATQTITVTNSGTIDGELKLTFYIIEDIAGTDPGFLPDVTMEGLSENLQVTVKCTVDGGTPVTIDWQRIGEAAASPIKIGSLAAGRSVELTLEYRILWEETGNEIQGASIKFNLVFDLEQKKPEA